MMTPTADTATTTTQRTHRYLRLSLVLIVFALLASVAIQTFVVSWQPFRLGWQVLPSISHYFYTPARSVFTGALIAASIALLALSGRGRAATLLDIAAIFAPLIALVPTGVRTDAPIVGLTCPDAAECIPAAFLDEVRLGIATYAVVVIAIVITMAVVRRIRRESTPPGTRLVIVIALATVAVISVLAFAPGWADGFPFNFWPYPASIHFVVTLLFFGTFAAVPIFHSRGPVDATETPPSPRQRRVYRVIAALLIADLVLLILAFVFRTDLGDIPGVLIGEIAALILFAAFWWVQTFQRWNDIDAPSLR